jgi:hypothetical protein
MPKSSLTSDKGKRILKAAQEREAIAIAARTAEAIERYATLSLDVTGLTEEADFEEPLDQSSSVQSGSIYWTRQVSEGSDQQVFSRSQGETLTIYKVPGSDRWVINYDEPVEDLPS